MKSSSYNEYSDNKDMWIKSGERIKNRIKEIKIKHNGKEKALTQKGLVEKCQEVGNISFHEQYISDWINGKKPIDPQYWHALCTVLDCDPEWLICELSEDCRHIQHVDAHDFYGLSEHALDILHEMNKFDLTAMLMIDALILERNLISSMAELWKSFHELEVLKAYYKTFAPEISKTLLLESPTEFPLDEESEWYLKEDRKQKEFELYKSLVDFMEGKGS